MDERRRDGFDDLVEATRMGSIFARDRKAYARWTNRHRQARPRRGLTGLALEAAVRGIQRQYPDNVIVGAA